jgi:hypothetical protein
MTRDDKLVAIAIRSFEDHQPDFERRVKEMTNEQLHEIWNEHWRDLAVTIKRQKRFMQQDQFNNSMDDLCVFQSWWFFNAVTKELERRRGRAWLQ